MSTDRISKLHTRLVKIEKLLGLSIGIDTPDEELDPSSVVELYVVRASENTIPLFLTRQFHRNEWVWTSSESEASQFERTEAETLLLDQIQKHPDYGVRMEKVKLP